MEYSDDLKQFIERCNKGKNPSRNLMLKLSADEKIIALEHLRKLSDKLMKDFNKIIDKNK